MIRSKRLQSVQQQPQAQSQPQYFRYSVTNDIEFIAMEPAANSTGSLQAVSGPPPLTYTGFLDEPFPLTKEPFQVIEPGSDLYVQTDPNICFDPVADGIIHQQDLLLSENGIPREVLEEAFGLDDIIEAKGDSLPDHYPVADHLSMAEYEAELVAEMEKLFPEKNRVDVPVARGSRLMQELTRVVPSDKPCYMSLHLKPDSFREGRRVSKLDILPREKEQGYCFVEMVDGNGKTFKAKYYESKISQTQSKRLPQTVVNKSVSTPTPYRRITDITKCPQLKDLTPAMASKIESLASGTRNVTLTPIRVNSSAPSRSNLTTPSSTTIVIKAPKRTIASNAEESVAIDSSFPMPVIKQEPLDEHPGGSGLKQQLKVIDSTRMDVPLISQEGTNINSKQPRKQKLLSLSQCDVVFKEAGNAQGVSGGSAAAVGGVDRKAAPRMRAPPNDFVTVTVKDSSNTFKKQPQQLNQIRSIMTRSPDFTVPTNAQSPGKRIFKKRVSTTIYRIQSTPKNKKIPGQPLESIEILDSSDEESLIETTTAPESETEDVPKPELPGNTESIQCRYCCRVFLSTHSLLLHRQNCADAVLFQQANKKQSVGRPAKEGVSLLKSSVDLLSDRKQRITSANNSRKTDSDPPSESARKESTKGVSRPKPQSEGKKKRSERLTIEILPTAFSIKNLLLCDVCSKTFRTQEHLDVHQKIHSAPTVCKYCKKKFVEAPLKHLCQEMKRSMS